MSDELGSNSRALVKSLTASRLSPKAALACPRRFHASPVVGFDRIALEKSAIATSSFLSNAYAVPLPMSTSEELGLSLSIWLKIAMA